MSFLLLFSLVVTHTGVCWPLGQFPTIFLNFFSKLRSSILVTLHGKEGGDALGFLGSTPAVQAKAFPGAGLANPAQLQIALPI